MTRRYPTEKKTTTKEGKRDYMRLYMRDRNREEKAKQNALLRRLKWNVRGLQEALKCRR